MDQRPNPDALLQQVKEQELRARRGKLTIFFGAAPGVGKTYAMLEAARAEMERERRDVALGVVETHGRYETAALVLGLELLPQRKLQYRGLDRGRSFVSVLAADRGRATGAHAVRHRSNGGG